MDELFSVIVEGILELIGTLISDETKNKIGKAVGIILLVGLFVAVCFLLGLAFKNFSEHTLASVMMILLSAVIILLTSIGIKYYKKKNK